MKKRKVYLILMLFVLFANKHLMAYDFIVDGIAYNITSTFEKTVDVTQHETQRFYSGDVVIPPTVTYDGITYRVTALGDNSLHSAPMVSISLPTTLRTIGSYSFDYCHNLRSLTIPEGVDSLGYFAITGCYQLESVSFPSTLASFAETICSACPELKTITVAPGNPKYDSRDNCNAIIETETNTLARGCSGSTIPNTVTTIGYFAFSGTTIDSLYIPQSVKRIESNNSFGIRKLYIDNIETICSIELSWFAEFIYDIYVGGKLLEGDVVIPNTVKKVGGFGNYNRINSVHISSSVEVISNCSFCNCKNLETITFDEGTTLIGVSAFRSCLNLRKITLPFSLRKIETAAFEGCQRLRSFHIPANVQTIGEWALAGCSSLALIVSDAQQPPAIFDNTFSEDTYKNVPLYVPKGTKSLYEATEHWKKFQAIIDDEEPIEDLNTFFEADGLCYHVSSVKDMEVSVVSYAYYHYNSGNTSLIPEEALDKETTQIVIPAHVTDKDNGLTFTVTRLDDDINDRFEKANSIRIPSTIREISPFFVRDLNYLPYLNLGSYDDMIFMDFYIEDLAAWCKINFIKFYNTEDNQSCSLYPSYCRNFNNLYLNDQLVENLVIPDGVTSISNAAFMCAQSIKTVEFPPSVKDIGIMAFSHTSLQKVYIPATIEHIGQNAFEGCFILKELTFEDGVKEIGIGNFADCVNLTKVSIPSSVEVIHDFAFRCCKGLNELTLAEGVKDIGEWAFACCESLNSISIPSSVKTIGRHAFNGCDSLNSIQLQEGLENIEQHAFTNCASLESLHIPASVKHIESSIVEDCKNLKTLTVAPSNRVYDTRDNGNILFETATNTIIAAAPEALIPQNTTSIGDYAFAYCSDRQSVVLPDGVKTIGNNAFLRCLSLHTITIPESVSSIGYKAFGSCESFEEVIAMAEEPCQMNDEAFTSGTYKSTTLYVPDGAVERYRNANGWKKFSHIEGYSVWLAAIESVKKQNGLTQPVIKVDSHRVLLSNLSANERISAYRLDGTHIKTVHAAQDGKAILVLPENGIYIIRTNTATQKVSL